MLLTADPVISEVLARNDTRAAEFDGGTGLLDYDYDNADWFEIHNRGTSSVDLSGWHFTDDLTDTTKWRVPVSTVLTAGDRLIVFASNKDYVAPNGELHTSFTFDGNGEAVGLADPTGQLVHGFTFGAQHNDVSYGIDESQPPSPEVLAFMEPPTPGAANGPGFSAVAQPPSFSVPAGTFTSNFSVTLSSIHPGAQIRYTTDRSLPTQSSTLYTGAISITDTTMVRARVYAADHVPSQPLSQTYIELGSTFADDSSNLPILVIDNFGEGDLTNKFDPAHRVFLNGSFMLFEPDATGRTHLTDTPTFTSRMGAHRRGNSSFDHAKPNLRLELRDENDNDRDFPLLGLSNDADWVLIGPYEEDRSQFRNALAFALNRDIGPWAPSTRFVELYYNTNGGSLSSFAEYMGTYTLTEAVEINNDRIDIARLSPNHTTDPERTGGYLIEVNGPKAGEPSWTTSHTSIQWIYEQPNADELTSGQRTYIQQYVRDFVDSTFAANYKDPVDGYRRFLDTQSLIDHHLLRFMLDEPQGFVVSEYWYKDRDGKLKQGPVWDSDRAIGNPHDQYDFFPTPTRIFTGKYFNTDLQPDIHEAVWLTQLFKDEVFAQEWVDRYWEHRQSTFTEANFTAIVDAMADELSEAQPRNESRWGEGFSGPYPEAEPGLSGWAAEVSHIKGWLDARLDFIDSLTLQPVTLTSVVGATTPFEITLSAPEGTINYTLDGSEPRAPNGQVSASAIQYTGSPIEITENAKVVARAYDPNAQPLSGTTVMLRQWSAAATEEFVFNRDVVISEVNYHPHAPTAAELAVMPSLEDDDFEFVELHNTTNETLNLAGMQFFQVDVNGNQEGIDFTFASQTLAPDERIVVVENTAAFQLRYGSNVRIADGDDGLGGLNGVYGNRLSNAGERLMLSGSSGITVHNFDYDDRGNWPDRADGDGSTLEVIDSSQPLNDPANWRPSAKYGGTPGAPPETPADQVIINEILTHTDLPNVDVVELYNPTVSPISIDGWWLSDSANNLDKYVIAGGHTVPAGGYLLLDEDDFTFGFNSSLGEQVWLVESDGSGNPDLIIDQLDFGAAENGVTFGRFPNATGELVPMVSSTLGGANNGPRFGPVVINEVMYHPPAPPVGVNADKLEFVEIYNPSPTTVDLSNWSISGIGYDFPMGSTIGPGKTLVIVPFDPVNDGTDIANFGSTYGVNIAANQSLYLGPYSGQLDNGGERITLLEADDPPPESPLTIPLVIEDYVDYDDAAPWTTDADGGGDSLNRQLVDLWGNDPTSWVDAAPKPGAIGASARTTYQSTGQETSVVGEVGTASGVTDAGQVVMLSDPFNNPVVFVRPASYNESDPVAVRVSDIQSDRFTVRLEEPTNEDGSHTGESISYIVFEAGTHELPDGSLLEVDTVETTATVGLFASHQWETVGFNSSFQTTPVLLTQIQTNNGLDYLNTRQRQVDTTEFEVALESQENVGAQQPTETIGYLALEPSSGTWDGLAYEAATTTRVITHNFSVHNFSQTFAAPPTLVANIAGLNENNNAILRYRNLGASSVELKIKEDTSFDAETNHSTEKVSYFAFDGQGLLTAEGAEISNGTTRSFTITVPDTGSATDVNMNLDIEHTHVSDLDLFLIGPDSTRVELFSGVGGSGNNFAGTILDDEALTPITAGSAPFSGSFQPEEALSTFNGRAISGTWTLEVTDQSSGSLLAPLLFEDSFDYDATSAALNIASAGVWGGGGTTIYDAGTNLTYPEYANAGGSGKMENATNVGATVAVSGPGGISDVQNVHGTYYAAALLSGPIDWWVRLGGIFFLKHGTSGNPNILYGTEDGTIDTGVDVGDGQGGIDLIVVKITSQPGNDEMRVVANPDLSNLTAVEAALNAAPAATGTNLSSGDGVTFTQFSRGLGLAEAWFDEMRWGTTLADVVTGIPGGGGPGSGDFGTLNDWSIEIDSISATTGNLNFDSAIDGRDIDLMYANVGLGDPFFDLTGNGTVDQADVDELVQNVLGTNYGDTDVDGDVDTSDLTRAIINFTSAGGSGKFWADGDIDGDGDVDTGDLTMAIIAFTGAGASGQPAVVSASDDAITGELNSHDRMTSEMDLRIAKRTAKRDSDNDSSDRATASRNDLHPWQSLAGGASRLSHVKDPYSRYGFPLSYCCS